MCFNYSVLHLHFAPMEKGEAEISVLGRDWDISPTGNKHGGTLS